MKAHETHLQQIIGRAEQQFIVPLFQRTYSWDKKEWGDLWDDLSGLFEVDEEGKHKTHFLGAIVTIPANVIPHGVTQYLLIDGQQRLTTLFLLLTVIRDKTNDAQLANKIHEQQLVNKFSKNSEFYRLQPTQQDCAAFRTLIDREPITEALENSRIVRCYRFFEKKLATVENLEKLSQIISHQLIVVSIVLDPNENPHLVFESLNARGKPLTQADLIRNYFFMRIAVERQETVFEHYWKPMQDALGEALTEYIRHYLIAIKASNVRKTDVYMALKTWVDDNKKEIIESLKEIACYASYYHKILYPQDEPITKIRQALTRIKRIEVTVAYPFLLKCYHDYAQKKLNEDEFCQVLHLIENIIIRRSVCSIASNSLNKIFPSVYRDACRNFPTDFIKGVAEVLRTKDYPDDGKFKEELMTANFYSASESRERSKLILESLEASYGHKESIDYEGLTIEHVMPQTIKGSAWQKELGENWEVTHSLYLHTLGNLTLTAYNGELSNNAFFEKKKLFADSHLELNHYFANISEWNEEQIKQRSEMLAVRALTIWAYIGNKPATTRKNQEITGSKPVCLLIKGEILPVKQWRDVLVQTFNFIAKEEGERFEELANRLSQLICKQENAARRSEKLINGYYIEVNLSAEHIYRLCKQAIAYLDYPSDDWQVEFVS
ncbi:DUF262 domain-containing protein [Beggiatoa leptomitoformis]|uniref:DUF262 domain-containing protein n=1 Tax=Beggiatoa leptomitoformis TaxID=288004 RepID=A0A2N9YAY7_9GAMM|nr:DUF262 domain-containing protein [Beggiatoa leptomitoformis]ALG67021.1 DUF262 domain-containing protein [Beggiatoa leptomitoformis]AUI67602.1 DUF262 domain-containing protein [Beggiatoa leptomitoformis]